MKGFSQTLAVMLKLFGVISTEGRNRTRNHKIK